MPSARVLLIESSRERQLDLAWRLESAGYLVRIEPDITHAPHTAAVFRPDIAVVGGFTGRDTGTSVLPALERDHRIPVITIRHIADPPPGESEGDEHDPVVRRVETALEASTLTRLSTLAAGDVVIDEGGHLALRADQLLELTQTEFELLVLFVRHRNQVLSKDALVAAVFTDRPVTPNTIEVHVANLRRKLEAVGPRIIHTVRSVGYVLRAPAADPYETRRQRLVEDRERLVRERNAAVARRDELQRERTDRRTS